MLTAASGEQQCGRSETGPEVHAPFATTADTFTNVTRGFHHGQRICSPMSDHSTRSQYDHNDDRWIGLEPEHVEECSVHTWRPCSLSPKPAFQRSTLNKRPHTILIVLQHFSAWRYCGHKPESMGIVRPCCSECERCLRTTNHIPYMSCSRSRVLRALNGHRLFKLGAM